MKLNITVFISLFFSAIIAKASTETNQYNDSSPDANENWDDEEDNSQDFQDMFKPSESLAGILNNSPDDEKEFINDGQVKETLLKTFSNALNTNIGKDGLEKVNREWQHIFEGSEASRVIGAFGYHVNKVFTSPTDLNIINVVTITAHMWLHMAGGNGEILNSGMGKILQSAFELFSSPQMPVIIDKAGILVTTAVNKPNAPLMVKQFWDELKNFSQQKDLDIKLEKTFVNLTSMMDSLHKQFMKTSARKSPTSKKNRTN